MPLASKAMKGAVVERLVPAVYQTSTIRGPAAGMLKANSAASETAPVLA